MEKQKLYSHFQTQNETFSLSKINKLNLKVSELEVRDNLSNVVFYDKSQRLEEKLKILAEEEKVRLQNMELKKKELKHELVSVVEKGGKDQELRREKLQKI